MKCAAFALFFVVLSSAYEVNVIDDVQSLDPEQPKYNLTDKQPKDNSYEVRHYADAKWAITTVQEFSEETAKRIGYNRLFDYMQGANEKGTEFCITVPFVMIVPANPCVFCRSNYIMSFYIPSIHQNNPPVPTHKEVQIESVVALKYYVKKFRGEASPALSKSVAHQLACDLRRNNVKKNEVESYHIFVAEYGNPLSGFHRHNEVWFVQSNRKIKYEIDGFPFSKDQHDEHGDPGYAML